MTKVSADLSMSLDGFITGPNDDIDNPLGEGGERLHEWIYGLKSWRERHGIEGGEASRDGEILEEAFRDTRAAVMGRRMFDLAEDRWGDEPPFHMPVFVVTHRPRETEVKAGGTSYAFVTDGIESALAQAREAAGEGDVSIAGGANVVQQCLAAGLLDELQVHVVPILLGDGVRLLDKLGSYPIELERTRVVESPAVTHLKFRVAR